MSEEFARRGWSERISGLCLDVIHVMEYVWEAATALLGERDNRREKWVRRNGLLILENRVGGLPPKSMQKRAKDLLQQIWTFLAREKAGKVFDHFLRVYRAKYPKAYTCMEKNREDLLAFHHFPAERWKRVRAGNVIESTFESNSLTAFKLRSSPFKPAGTTFDNSSEFISFHLSFSCILARTSSRLLGMLRLRC